MTNSLRNKLRKLLSKKRKNLESDLHWEKKERKKSLESNLGRIFTSFELKAHQLVQNQLVCI